MLVTDKFEDVHGAEVSGNFRFAPRASYLNELPVGVGVCQPRDLVFAVRMR